MSIYITEYPDAVSELMGAKAINDMVQAIWQNAKTH